MAGRLFAAQVVRVFNVLMLLSLIGQLLTPLAQAATVSVGRIEPTRPVGQVAVDNESAATQPRLAPPQQGGEPTPAPLEGTPTEPPLTIETPTAVVTAAPDQIELDRNEQVFLPLIVKDGSPGPQPQSDITLPPLTTFELILTSLDFDGGDYVALVDLPLLTEFTLEAWVKRTADNDAYQTFLSDANDNYSEVMFTFFVDGDSVECDGDEDQFAFYGGSDTQCSGVTAEIDEWYHVAVSRDDNGTQRFFVDGVLQDTITDTDEPADSEGLLAFGRAGDFDGEYFEGLIDEVRISNVALYTQTFSAPTTALAATASTVGLWHLNEGTGQSAGDSSGNGRHGTLGSSGGSDDEDPAWSTDTPLEPTPPQALFSAVPLTGAAPLTVTFSDGSTGDILTRTWTFGDGSGLITDTITVTHIYAAAGVYTVTLTATGPVVSDTLTRTNYITATGFEGLDFSASPMAGTAPLTVSFTSLVTPSGSYTYSWDFGDGGASALLTPTHTYTAPGAYTVSLTVASSTASTSLSQVNAVLVTDPLSVTLGVVTPAGGVITSADGTFSLDFAPGAVTETLIIGIAQTDLTEVITSSSQVTPTLIVPGYGLPFEGIELEAWRTNELTNPLTIQFQTPVTITYSYSPTVVDELVEETLTFVYFDASDDPDPEDDVAEGRYVSIPTTVNSQTLQLTSAITHFSSYGVAGDKAGWSTPGLDAFQVSLSRGAATYSYQIPLPAGPAGLSPNLSLQYNSHIPNGMVGEKNTDTGWMGIGWVLDLGHMTKDRISLNNVNEDIFQAADGTFHTEHQTYMRINRIAVSPPTASGVELQESYRWEVTDRAGTTYFFGLDGADGSTLSYLKNHEGSCKWRHRVYKLYKVVDIHGNTLKINYTNLKPAPESWPYDCGLTSDEAKKPIRASYPASIEYTTGNGDSHAEYRVTFEIVHKGYSPAPEAKYGDFNYKLTAVKIWYVPPGASSEAQWQLIRTVGFNYLTDVEAKTNLLQSLVITGANGASSLPPLQFEYTEQTIRPSERRTCYTEAGVEFRCGHWAMPESRFFLTQVTNNYGAMVGFGYQGKDNPKTQQPGWYVVNRRWLTDTITGQNAETQYTFVNPSYYEIDDVFDISHFYGFSQAEMTDPLGQKTIQFFDNSFRGILNGYNLSTWFYDPAGNLYSASLPTWTTADGVAYGWPEEVKFVYQSEQNNYTCFGLTTGQTLTGCLRKRTASDYDVQYGVPTQERQYLADGSTVYRRTETSYFNNVSGNNWLIGLPRQQSLHTGAAGGAVATSQFYYDNDSNLGSPTTPTVGLLTLQRVMSGTHYVDSRTAYDDRGNVLTQTVYDSYGSSGAVASTNPRQTATSYDVHDLLPVTVVNPAGHEVTSTYDYRFQAPTVVTDSNNAATTTSYDTFGRVTAVTLPACSGATFLAEYNDGTISSSNPYFERARQRIDNCSGGASYADTYVYYDGLGRKIQSRATGDSGNFILNQVEYDKLGRVIRSWLPYSVGTSAYGAPIAWGSGVGTTTSYDPLGRNFDITAPDNALTKYRYALDSNFSGGPTNRLLTVVTDPNDHARHLVNDEFGRLIRVREFSGTSAAYTFYGETEYAYDIRDNLTQVTDALDNLTTMTYDGLGRKVAMADPDLGLWRYSYDALGSLTTQTDARGVTTSFAYDNLNRVTTKSFSDDTPTVTYGYDAGANGLGRRTAMTDTAGAVTWRYDSRGRVVSEARSFAESVLDNTFDATGIYTTSYTYNAADWPLSLTYPDGEVVTTGYTNRGLATTLSGTANYVTSAGYNALGQMTARAAGNGLNTAYTYYSASAENNRLQRLQVGSLLDLNYDYDTMGNIISLTDDSAAAGGESLSFSYDHLDRLKTASTTESGNLAGYNHTYNYNVIGNISSKVIDGQSSSYAYSDTNHIHAVTGVATDTYSYDANGNMTGRSEAGTSYGQTWNGFNKLERVTWTQGGQFYTTTFVYDGDDNRLLKIEDRSRSETDPTPLEITTLYLGQLYEKQFNTTADDLSGEVAVMEEPFDKALALSIQPISVEGSSYGKGLALPLAAITTTLVLTDSPPVTSTSPLTDQDRLEIRDETFRATFDATGLNFNRLNGAGDIADQSLTYELLEIRRGSGILIGIDSERRAPTRVTDAQLMYTRSPQLLESYRQVVSGVEQYFILITPPAGTGDLVLVSRLQSALRAELQSAREGVWFYDRTGEPQLRYSGAWVYDQAGRGIWADLRLEGDQLYLTVPDAWLADALYPVVIDPLIGSDFNIATSTSQQQYPQVAYNGDNNQYLAVWRDINSGTDVDIRAVRMSATGSQVGSELTLENSGNQNDFTDVAYSPTSDVYLAIWTQESSTNQIQGRRVTANGSVTGSVIGISTATTNSVEGFPAVAYNSDDDQFLAVWAEANSSGDYHVYARRVDATDGSLVGSVIGIATGSGNDSFPQVIYNPQADEYLIVWQHHNGTVNNIYAQRVSGTGSLTGSNFQVSSSSSPEIYAAIAYNSQANQYLIVWSLFSSLDPVNIRIWGRLLNANGTFVDSSFQISNTGSTHQQRPEVIYHTAANEYLVVWEECNDVVEGVTCIRASTSPYDLRARRVGSNGSLSLQDGGLYHFYISNASDGQFSHDMAYNSTNAAIMVMWDDSGELYGQRYDPPDEVTPTGWANFTPASGWQTTSPVNVSLQVTDAYTGLNSSTAQVRYSTNSGSTWSSWQTASCSGCGSGPNNTATLSAALSGLTQGTTNRVQFRISDLSGNQATSSAYTVWLDTAAPPTPTMTPEPTYTAGSSNTVAWSTVTDSVSGGVQYQTERATNGSFTSGVVQSAWQSGNSQVHNSLANCQTYYYRVRSRDGATNTSGWSSAVSSEQDYNPPTSGSISIENGDDWTSNTTVQLTLNVSDACAANNELELRLKNESAAWSGWLTYQSTVNNWSLSAGDGLKTVSVQFRDPAGWESSVYTDTITYDGDSPQITAFTLTPPATTGVVTVAATISDASPVTWSIEVRQGGESGTLVASTNGSGGTVNWTWDSSSEAEDDYTVILSASDSAGTEPSTTSGVIIVDRTAPVITVYQPGTFITWGSSQVLTRAQTTLVLQGLREVTDTGQSEVGLVEVWRTGGMTVTASLEEVNGTDGFSATLTDLLTDTLNIVNFRHTDQAGNSQLTSRSLYIDTSQPFVTDFSPTGLGSDSTPTLSGQFVSPGGSAIVQGSVVITLDNKLVNSPVITPGGFSVEVASPLADGGHTVVVYLENEAGSSGQTGWPFSLDTTTWVEIDDPVEAAILNSSPITVSGRAEAGSVITLTVDSSPISTTTVLTDEIFSFAPIALSNSGHALAVLAVDPLGNSAQDSHSVTMDTSGIAVSIQANPASFAPYAAFNTATNFQITAAAPAGDDLAAWHWQILAGSQVVTETTGFGPPPPSIRWDGRDDLGEVPTVDTTYDYTILITSTLDTAQTPTKPVTVNVAPPGKPIIITPTGHITQGRATVNVAGTAPGSAVDDQVVVWLETEEAAVIWAGDASVAGDLSWSVPQVVLDSGQNILWATVTDSADQESVASDPVTVTVQVLPPLKSVDRSPFPAGLNHTLLFTATARGDDPETPYLGQTTYVTATLVDPNGEPELLLLDSTNQTDPTSLWTADRTLTDFAGQVIEYEVGIEGRDADGNHNTSYIGLRIDGVTPGTPRITHPALNRTVNDPTFRVEGTAPKHSIVHLLVDTETYTTVAGNYVGTWAITITLATGDNMLRARAEDDAGNFSPYSSPVILTLDQTPPEVSAEVEPLIEIWFQPITITAIVTETGPLYLGYVWTAVEGPDPAPRRNLIENDPVWQETFDSGVDGIYTATVSARDVAGNIATTEGMTFTIDGTPPTLDLTITTAPPYGYLVGQTLYYGEGSGSFTLTANAADALSGLDVLTFPTTTAAGQVFDFDGELTAEESHTYAFSAASTFSNTVSVTATDRAGNLTPTLAAIFNDNVAPTVALTVPTSAALDFSLAWAATDAASGVRAFNLGYGSSASGPWTAWLTSTTDLSAAFLGLPDESYYFRVQAVDNVGNVSSWLVEGPVTINTVTKYYYHGGQRVAMRQGDGVYYLSGDHLGSTALTTDSAGQVVHQARYLPYGAERWSSGAGVTDYTYTGQRVDGFGLYDYNARFYSGRLGRFISADTLVPEPGNPQAFNRYTYVVNNPLRYTDPTGHCPLEGVSFCRAIDPNLGGGLTGPVSLSKSSPARVFYLNQIGNVGGNPWGPNPDPSDEQGYIIHQVGQVIGPENVKSIPIYHGDVTLTRFQMFAEMFEYRIWSPVVADAIAEDIEANPLRPSEKLIMIGNSGGGTVAIESLDLLKEKGIYVDQIILRGSPVREWKLENVGQVDYITSNFDYYYSFDINPFDAVSVREHRLDFWGHVPPNDKIRRQIGDLIANLVSASIDNK